MPLDPDCYVQQIPCGCVADLRNPGGRLREPCGILRPILERRQAAFAALDAAKAALDAVNEEYWGHFDGVEWDAKGGSDA